MGVGYQAYIQSLRDRNALLANQWAKAADAIGDFLVPNKPVATTTIKQYGGTSGGKSGGTSGGQKTGTGKASTTSSTVPERYIAIEEESDTGEIHDMGFQPEMTGVELSSKSDYDELERDRERGYITQDEYTSKKEDLDKRNPDLNPQLQGSVFAPMAAEMVNKDVSRKKENTNRDLLSDRFARESLSTTRDFNFNMMKSDKVESLSKVAGLKGLVGEFDNLRDAITEYAITPTIRATRDSGTDDITQYTKNEDKLTALHSQAESAINMINKGIDNIDLKLETVGSSPEHIMEISKLKAARNELERQKDNISLLKKVNPNLSSVIGKVQVSTPEYLDNLIVSIENISKDIDQHGAMAQLEELRAQLLNGTDKIGPMNLRDKNSIKQHVNSNTYKFVMNGILTELESIRETRISGEELNPAESRYLNEKEDKLLIAYDNLKALQLAEPETDVNIRKQKRLIEDIDNAYAQLKSTRELIPEDVKMNIEEHPDYIAAKQALDIADAKVQQAAQTGSNSLPFAQQQADIAKQKLADIEAELGKEEAGKTDYIRPITEIIKEGSTIISDKEKTYYVSKLEQLKKDNQSLRHEADIRKELMSIPRNRAGELKLIIDKARSGGVISAKENKELKTIVSDMNDQINEENAAFTKVISVAQTIRPQTLKGEWGKYTPEETEIPADMKNYLLKRGIMIPNNMTNLNEFKDWVFGKMEANKKDKMLLNKVGRFAENPEAMKDNIEWVDRLMYLKRDFGTQAENAREEYGAITSKIAENYRKIKEISKGLSIADKNKSRFEDEIERLNNRIADKLEDLAKTEVTKTKSSLSGMAYSVARKIEALTESRMENASARDKTTSAYDALLALNHMASSYADRMLNKYYEGVRKERDVGLVAPEAMSERERLEKRKAGIEESPEYREYIRNLGRERFLKVHPIGSVEWWKQSGLADDAAARKANPELTFEQKKELLEIDRQEKLALENARSENQKAEIRLKAQEDRKNIAFKETGSALANQWEEQAQAIPLKLARRSGDIYKSFIQDMRGKKITNSDGADVTSSATLRSEFEGDLWSSIQNHSPVITQINNILAKGPNTTDMERRTLISFQPQSIYLNRAQVEAVYNDITAKWTIADKESFIQSLLNAFK